jgi:hypothetical protein
MFISSLHNIKSENFKKIINKKNFRKKTKEICFAFDAFGQWRMKVEIEWSPSIAGRPMICSRPTTFSLLSSFPLHCLSL